MLRHSCIERSFNSQVFTFLVQNIALAFDTLSGQLTSVTQKQLGVSLPFGQSLRYYEAYAVSGQQASGAYIFRTAANTSNALPLTSFSYIVVRDRSSSSIGTSAAAQHLAQSHSQSKILLLIRVSCRARW